MAGICVLLFSVVFGKTESDIWKKNWTKLHCSNQTIICLTSFRYGCFDSRCSRRNSQLEINFPCLREIAFACAVKKTHQSGLTLETTHFSSADVVARSKYLLGYCRCKLRSVSIFSTGMYSLHVKNILREHRIAPLLHIVIHDSTRGNY